MKDVLLVLDAVLVLFRIVLKVVAYLLASVLFIPFVLFHFTWERLTHMYYYMENLVD